MQIEAETINQHTCVICGARQNGQNDGERSNWFCVLPPNHTGRHQRLSQSQGGWGKLSEAAFDQLVSWDDSMCIEWESVK
jgi:hypothetical protein